MLGGGKLLMNFLKELLLFRQYDLMGETRGKESIQTVKDRMGIYNTEVLGEPPGEGKDPRGCFDRRRRCAADEHRTVRSGGASVQAPVILICASSNSKESGQITQVLSGLAQAGLSHTVADVISSLPEDMQELFWANVGLIGGNVRLPGFRNSLMTELRSLEPAEHEVRIYESSNPIIAAYLAGAEFVRQPGLANVCVTRAEYQEAGSRACRRKFKYATWQVREDGERTPQGPGKDTGNNAGLSRSRIRSRGSKTQGDVGDSRAERKRSRSSRSRAADKA
ncbi:ARP6_3 [Sanghuangporus sanghuang]